MMIPGIDDLFFMGLAQPLPTLVNFAEQQSKLAAAYLTRRLRASSADEMHRIIARNEAFHLGAYYSSSRHTIQVDFQSYVADLLKEIERGDRRNASPGSARLSAR